MGLGNKPFYLLILNKRVKIEIYFLNFQFLKNTLFLNVHGVLFICWYCVSKRKKNPLMTI